MIKDKKIIVVGNGPSVLKHKLRKIINNDFDLILRFNNFETKGYEKYIGDKTDIWARNNAYTVKNRSLSAIKKILILSPSWNYKKVFRFYRFYSPKKMTIIPKRFSLEIEKELGFRGRIDKNGEEIREWASTGVYALYYLISRRPKQIYIHGFDNFEGENHYFKKENKLSFIKNIREKEKKWIQNKINQGIFKTII